MVIEKLKEGWHPADTRTRRCESKMFTFTVRIYVKLMKITTIIMIIIM